MKKIDKILGRIITFIRFIVIAMILPYMTIDDDSDIEKIVDWVMQYYIK